MPLINFNSPVVEKNKNIGTESVIQIEVNNKTKDEIFDREEFWRKYKRGKST